MKKAKKKKTQMTMTKILKIESYVNEEIETMEINEMATVETEEFQVRVKVPVRDLQPGTTMMQCERQVAVVAPIEET